MDAGKNIFECVVSDIEGIDGKIHYYATESEITNEDFSSKVYGIKIENVINGITKDCTEISDVTGCYDKIIVLVKKMASGLVTPVTAGDIVEDFVNSNV